MGAIIELSQRVDIKNIFSQCKIKKTEEDLIEEETLLDIAGEINALISIRNNIIHEDQTPTLTYLRIAQFRKELIDFTQEIARVLNEKIDDMNRI